MTDSQITLTVNGQRHTARVPMRMLLSDFLRHELRLTGTHIGCGHGVCGACTIEIDGATARSCLMLAVQADGAAITTVEGLAGAALHPVQQAFHEHHALQCGYCTSGFLAATIELLRENPDPSEAEIREALHGNLCRCTGYVNIVHAVRRAAELMRA